MVRLVHYFIATAVLGFGTLIGVDAVHADIGRLVSWAHVLLSSAATAQVIAPRDVAPHPARLHDTVAIAPVSDRKLIAIVIDDLGVDRARSARAASLPASVTLAFLPYARDFEMQIEASRKRGHEILVHVPMEPVGAKNPGPDALTVALDGAEIRRRLRTALDRAGLAVGINNHMGSRFTVDREAMRPVFEELKARGLLFLDSRTTGATVGPELARSMDVPYAVRDVFLDNDPTFTAVQARLKEVEAAARRQGHAVAIGHPHDGTLDALVPWLTDVAARGFELVPISIVARLSLEARQGS